MSIDIDPVTMQVVGNYCRTVSNEVEVAMIRAAHSPVIKEAFGSYLGENGLENLPEPLSYLRER